MAKAIGYALIRVTETEWLDLKKPPVFFGKWPEILGLIDVSIKVGKTKRSPPLWGISRKSNDP